MARSYHLSEMTWEEVKDVAAKEVVAVLPVATYEDHGYHLPLDTDVVLCSEVCRRGAEMADGDAVLVPPVSHGYSPHHMDFPGTITIEWNTFLSCVLDVCRSLVHHGFKRILVVNGHGSNHPFCDIAARLTTLKADGRGHCASVSYWGLAPVIKVAAQIRESELGGMAHACEFETSLYLAIKPELVRMKRAVREMGQLRSPSFVIDLAGGKPPGASHALLMPYWSSVTESGVMGDPTKASAEKGEMLLRAAAEGLRELISEFKALPIRKRVDHH